MIENRIHITFVDRKFANSTTPEIVTSLSEAIKSLLFRSEEIQDVHSTAKAEQERKSFSFSLKDRSITLTSLNQTKVGKILQTIEDLFISETYKIQ